MESAVSILHNYYLVCQWHRHAFEPESFDLEALHRENVMENEEEEIGKESDKDLSPFVKEDREGVSGMTLLTVRRQLRVSRKVGVVGASKVEYLVAGAAAGERLHRLQQAGQQQHAPHQADRGERPVRVLHADRRNLLRKPVARAEVEADAEAVQVREPGPQQHAGSLQEQSGDGDVAGVCESMR